jgi:hypothetical protein
VWCVTFGNRIAKYQTNTVTCCMHQYTKKCPYRDGRLAIAITIGMAIANMYAYSHTYRCILRSIGMMYTYGHTYRDGFRPIV